jgi:hypothetical protein
MNVLPVLVATSANEWTKNHSLALVATPSKLEPILKYRTQFA